MRLRSTSYAIATVLQVAGALMFVAALFLGSARAFGADTSVPHAATRYRADLIRISREAWGIDAPVAVFAAQIHQESGWNPAAISRVGAQGMAQFMPATARWWCELNKLSPAECQPSNPVWAMRALVGYDRWLYQRVRGASEFDRFWAALRAYNGGLGHWQQEAATVRPSIERAIVDGACGSARRNRVHCAENLGYPQRIINVLQPRYFTWGRGVKT